MTQWNCPGRWVTAAGQLLALVLAASGCGSQNTADVAPRPQVTVSFARPRTTPVGVEVGAQIAVQKSVGDCSSPFSTNVRILAPARSPSARPDCTPGQVLFRAVGVGRAELEGQAPCHGTECTAVLRQILITVRR